MVRVPQAATQPPDVPMTPAISIVLPAYNAAATVGRALASIVAQDFSDWDLLLIDDGTTDGTAAAALNIGLAAARSLNWTGHFADRQREILAWFGRAQATVAGMAGEKPSGRGATSHSRAGRRAGCRTGRARRPRRGREARQRTHGPRIGTSGRPQRRRPFDPLARTGGPGGSMGLRVSRRR